MSAIYGDGSNDSGWKTFQTDSDKRMLNSYDRFIPKEGITISMEGKWSIFYKDANDISENSRLEFRNYFKIDPAYIRTREIDRNFPKGLMKGKSYCAYAWLEDKIIGSMLYIEYLDHPEGYGKDDFYLTKFIMPEFRWTKHSRNVSTNLMDIFFIKNLMRRIYSYVIAKREGKQGDFWHRLEEQTPCFGRLYPTDGPTVQKYMMVKKEIHIIDPMSQQERSVLIIEMDGEKYREMNLHNYFLSTLSRSCNERLAQTWLKHIHEVAEKVEMEMRT